MSLYRRAFLVLDIDLLNDWGVFGGGRGGNDMSRVAF